MPDTGAASAKTRKFADGEYIVHQGDAADCMYVIHAGVVEVVARTEGREVSLALLGEGEFFGEMAFFEGGVRTASVRAFGEAEIETLDRKQFLLKLQDDPSLAFTMISRMSERSRDLTLRLHDLGALLPAELDSMRTFGNAYPVPFGKKQFEERAKANPQVALTMLNDMSFHIRDMNNRLVALTPFDPEAFAAVPKDK
jgi:CRP/FNR family transcriptional regulator, cyclic AMP receptor protein